jgi:hypothetical protein
VVGSYVANWQHWPTVVPMVPCTQGPACEPSGLQRQPSFVRQEKQISGINSVLAELSLAILDQPVRWQVCGEHWSWSSNSVCLSVSQWVQGPSKVLEPYVTSAASCQLQGLDGDAIHHASTAGRSVLLLRPVWLRGWPRDQDTQARQRDCELRTCRVWCTCLVFQNGLSGQCPWHA